MTKKTTGSTLLLCVPTSEVALVTQNRLEHMGVSFCILPVGSHYVSPQLPEHEAPVLIPLCQELVQAAPTDILCKLKQKGATFIPLGRENAYSLWSSLITGMEQDFTTQEVYQLEDPWEKLLLSSDMDEDPFSAQLYIKINSKTPLLQNPLVDLNIPEPTPVEQDVFHKENSTKPTARAGTSRSLIWCLFFFFSLSIAALLISVIKIVYPKGEEKESTISLDYQMNQKEQEQAKKEEEERICKAQEEERQKQLELARKEEEKRIRKAQEEECQKQLELARKEEECILKVQEEERQKQLDKAKKEIECIRKAQEEEQQKQLELAKKEEEERIRKAQEEERQKRLELAKKEEEERIRKAQEEERQKQLELAKKEKEERIRKAQEEERQKQLELAKKEKEERIRKAQEEERTRREAQKGTNATDHECPLPKEVKQASNKYGKTYEKLKIGAEKGCPKCKKNLQLLETR